MVIVHRQFIKKVLNLVKTGKINKTAGFLLFSLENPNKVHYNQTIFTDTLLH